MGLKRMYILLCCQCRYTEELLWLQAGYVCFKGRTLPTLSVTKVGFTLTEALNHFLHIAQILILMMAMFGTAMPTLLSFPEERPVFLREYSTNHYGVVAYFLTRLAMEALITFFQVIVLVSSNIISSCLLWLMATSSVFALWLP